MTLAVLLLIVFLIIELCRFKLAQDLLIHLDIIEEDRKDGVAFVIADYRFWVNRVYLLILTDSLHHAVELPKVYFRVSTEEHTHDLVFVITFRLSLLSALRSPKDKVIELVGKVLRPLQI